MSLRRFGGASLGMVALACAACIVTSPAAPSSSKAVRYPLRVLTLDNGMKVLLEQAPDFGVAAVVLLVGSGAASEAPDKAGLAHLTEHLVFEGKHAGQSLADCNRELGGFANAATSWDATTFYATGATSSVEEVVAAMHAIIKEPLAGVDMDAGIFRREWLVVSDEMRWRTETGTPTRAIGRLMSAAFREDHPYAHPVTGTSSSLARLRMADVRAFTAAYYRPEQSTLVISAPLPVDVQQAMVERITGQHVNPRGAPRPAGICRSAPPMRSTFETYDTEVPTPTLWLGDVDAAEVFDAAESQLGSWGRGAASSARRPDPLPLIERRASDREGAVLVQHRPGARQPIIRFQCLLPPLNADTYASYEVFAKTFEGRLFKELREDAGASYHVYGQIDVFPGGTTLFDLSADLDYARLGDSLRHVRALSDETGARFARSPSVAQTQARLAEDWRLDFPTTHQIASELFSVWNLGWQVEMLDRLSEQSLRTRPELVARLADHCHANAVIGILGDEPRIRRAWEQSTPLASNGR